jgi:uncharacterized protein
MPIRRRALLETAAVAALGRAAMGCHSQRATPGPLSARLVHDEQGVLDLPEGFSYRILQRSGDLMSDGYRVPGRPDGMGCFAGEDGQIVLMRNHELAAGDRANSAYSTGQAAPPQAYDAEATGGVTRVVLDADTLEIARTNLVLSGTYWNCAGGLSPWGWLSCEETVDDLHHGFVFLCAADAEQVQAPRRIPGYGRMRHEAAAVDPMTSIAYLTEDRLDSCFYRFVPVSTDRPFEGVLQALRVPERPALDTSAIPLGERLAIDWVDIDDVHAFDDGMRARAQQQGAARIRRGEGLWLSDDAAYFTATAGGPSSRGQVFRLGFEPDATLEVIADGETEDSLDMPDNLCISPHGQIYVAEDGSGENFVRRLGLDGRSHPFARNIGSFSEVAGICFSPDGRTLFLNLQGDGLTIAIRGPFERPLEGEEAAGEALQERALRRDWSRGTRGVGSGLAVLALAAFERRRRTAARGA